MEGEVLGAGKDDPKIFKISVCQGKVKLLASGVLLGRRRGSEQRRWRGNHLQALQDPSDELAFPTCLGNPILDFGRNNETEESARKAIC